MELEILVLRHELAILRWQPRRARLRPAARATDARLRLSGAMSRDRSARGGRRVEQGRRRDLGRAKGSDTDAACSFGDRQVVLDQDRAELEADVIVRAQTQDVRFDVWPVVGAAQRTYVRAFGIATSGGLYDLTADLADVVMQFLDANAHRRIAHEPLNGRLGSRSRTRGNRISRYRHRRPASTETHQPVPTDLEPRNPRLSPRLFDAIQPVVTESSRRRMRRLSTRTSDHPNRKPLGLASNQREVLSPKLLIRDLLTRGGIAATSPGVDNEIPIVLIVLVATTDHDRIGTLARTPRNAVLKRAMHTSPCQRPPAAIRRPRRVPRDLAKETRHRRDPGETATSGPCFVIKHERPCVESSRLTLPPTPTLTASRAPRIRRQNGNSLRCRQ